MIRRHLTGRQLAGEADFVWRGTEVTRLEGFSDAVFAFAVTLLVVSLEVPKTFPEFMLALHGFLAFGVCFALLANVWSEHHRFFRRYGLQDSWAIFLNCALLFFVLFYVYPLKFLFTAVFNQESFEPRQGRMLFTIFGLGWAAVFLVFALLYRHAWAHRDTLELSPIERLRTRRGLFDHIVMVIIGVASVLLVWALPAAWVGVAGYWYFSVGIYFTIAGRVHGRRERALQQPAA